MGLGLYLKKMVRRSSGARPGQGAVGERLGENDGGAGGTGDALDEGPRLVHLLPLLGEGG